MNINTITAFLLLTTTVFGQNTARKSSVDSQKSVQNKRLQPNQVQSTQLTVTDIDKNVYTTIRIGNQIWMAENLKVTHYRNGDEIPNVRNGKEWESLSTGAFCDYDNNPIYGDKYGKLYNFYAVSDDRNIAPRGWHVATDKEWSELQKHLILNGFNFDGTKTENKIAKSIASTDGWAISYNAGETGCDLKRNNSSHFNALPATFRFTEGAFTYSLGHSANFWTATASRSDYAWNRYISFEICHLSRDSGRKVFGLSVRCIKD